MLATKEAYFELARSIGKQGGISADSQSYFEQHRDRLWSTIDRFQLLDRRVERVLDIGPYFGFTPFLWKEKVAGHVSVFEGDSPEAAALQPLYRDKSIEVTYGDLFRVFDESATSAKRLPYADDTFDFVCCWETMEHFNFNPVPFVRELRRVTRGGGFVCITVPNVAKLDRRLKLLFGHGIATPIHDYQITAGIRYLGLHWREYTLGELTELFRRNDFTIEFSGHVQAFQNRTLTPAGKLKRALARVSIALVPGFGALCAVKARK